MQRKRMLDRQQYPAPIEPPGVGCCRATRRSVQPCVCACIAATYVHHDTSSLCCCFGRGRSVHPPSQPSSQRIVVVPSVCKQLLGILPGTAPAFAGNRDSVQRPLDERDFRLGRTVVAASQRNNLVVDHHHRLCALPLLGCADTEAPFSAGAKLPSTKASDQFNWPWASNSAREARHPSSQMSLAPTAAVFASKLRE